MHPTDAELVSRSRRNDAAAFGSLVERHQDLVFGVALARCGDPELASDLVQDAFVVAWKTLENLREVDRVGPWVAGIVRNLASGATRARAREAKLAPEAAAPTAVPTPEDAALEREGRELVQHALADLPETHREVLVLHYFQAQSIAAIADGIGVSQDLVKQRLSRGRRAVRDQIARLLDDGRLRMRPRTGLVASVVAAVTMQTSEAAAATAAGKMIVMTTGTKKLAIAGAIGLALAGGATWIAGTQLSSATTGAAPASAAGTAAAPSDAARPHAAHTATIRRIAPADRARLLARIRDARKTPRAPEKVTTPAIAPAIPSAAAAQTLEAYVLAAIQQIMPLLKECYALHPPPMLPGRLMIQFTIEGEPEIGGLVGDSQIVPGESTLQDPKVRECIQETMYALELEPPERGVTHRMRTALVLHPDGEPDSSGIDTHDLKGPE